MVRQMEARKYEASRRVVPTAPPLLGLLKRRHLELGRPTEGLACPPLASRSPTGLLNSGWLATAKRERQRGRAK